MGIFPDDTSQLFIDGELRAASGGTYPVLNPATGAEIGRAANAGVDDTAAAVAAARRAFDSTDWSRDHALRARCLRQLQNAIESRIEEIRQITIDEVGAPRYLTTGPQLEEPVKALTHYADLCESYEWVKDMGTGEIMGYVSRRELRREAAGVVAAITPWNFPHQIIYQKIAPALAAGCTVVLKAAPDTPWTAALLGIVATETELPPGVLNVLTASRNEVGQQLVESPDVDVISFTGSTATGKQILATGAETLKRVHLELGGKSASVVLDDADLGTACFMTVINALMHAGQGCALTTRLVVPREQLAEAIEITRGAIETMPPQDPNAEGTLVGPIINQRQLDRIAGYIDIARHEGGTIECGGEVLQIGEGGWWFAPTLVSGLGPDSRLAQEEIFGPVITILAHDGDDDAIAIANNSPYGLSGQVFGSTPERVERVVAGVRTGTMGVNGAQWYGLDMPFGGYKQSGIGRELGVEGFEEYLESKSVGFPVE